MATDIYIKVENEDGEVLTEEACSEESIGAFAKTERDEEAFVLSLNHKVTLPTDTRSGQVTGAPRHEFLKISKYLDKSSPLLAGALVNPTDLEVEITFCRPGEGGEMEEFYTITLTSAKIVGIETISPSSMDPANDSKVAYEEITFTYGQIDWEHEICSTSATDDAKGR